MFGRFFAFEMGCPEDNASMPQDGLQPLDQPQDQVMTLDEIQAMQSQAQDQSQDQGQPAVGGMICECKGLGCKKCKRKKAKVITLTGRNQNIPLPVMNLPMAPFQPSMIMMGKPGMF